MSPGRAPDSKNPAGAGFAGDRLEVSGSGARKLRRGAALLGHALIEFPEHGGRIAEPYNAVIPSKAALEPSGLAEPVEQPEARRGQRPVERAEDEGLQEVAGERQAGADVARTQAVLG